MGNKSTSAKLNQRNGELTVQQQETDSPIIPVAQLEHLHNFRPELVDWVITQTQTEAEHRRSQDKRINTFIFVGKTLGQVFGLIIGLAGIVAGTYTAMNGQPAAGGAIALVSIGTLGAVSFNRRPPK